MKKKILLILFIIIVIIGTFFVGRQVGLNTEDGKTKTIVREETVSKQDIKKTLTSSGQVESKTTEQLELSTSKYFKAMCVEDDDTVKAGENILQYSNGTYLTAPYDCVIISHSVPDTGSKCKDSHYVEVSNLDTLVTTITINENEINSVAVDQDVEIVLSADESKKYTGKVTKIDSVGTYATSGTTFSATVEFENDDTIKLGMNVSCTVIIKEEKDITSVPIDAVSENSEGKEYVVKVNSDGTTEEVIVETGIADDNYVQILSGLSENDKVQIETELTENTSSSSSDSKMGGFGGPSGEERGSQGGDRSQMKEMMQAPSGDMPSGGRQGSSK